MGGTPGAGAAKRIVLESAGWILLLAGVAAIFLPGPGLLGIFAGLALLSQRYEWAERRVEPVRLRALRGAAEGVENWFRITLSVLGAVVLGAFGVLWILKPPPPDWWRFSDSLWLPGGLWTGITQVASMFIALALIAYSYRRFYGKPDAVAELTRNIATADSESDGDPTN